jgi:hypothetical protein
MTTLTLLASVAALVPQTPSQGVGDLLVAPTRVVLENTKRTAEVNLLNTGNKPATYRISFIHQRMNEEGKLEEVVTPGPDEKFADDLVRFTPRQVVLEPHVAQLVRIQMRLPADLAAGEYRSHLLFRAVPVAAPEAEEKGYGDAKGINIKITPIYGISIPVIVRTGETSAVAKFEGLQFAQTPEGAPVVVGKLNRTGNASVYGQVLVTFAPKGGPFRTVAQVNGLAVYTPNATRNFAVRLAPPEGTKLANGILKVTYRQMPNDGDKVLAESTLSLP